ncbi:MAG: MgtC/SapB family protein [Clostridia bacterium]|nr:MgtC/SapB family protein [Clostridia bacterium]
MPEILRSFSFLSVCLRLAFAFLTGVLIGFGRAQKKQAAGMRTYVITCVAASLSTLIALYFWEMTHTDPVWAGIKVDGVRYPAAVISGIGFLAAGGIWFASHHQVSGLTTAVGLFTTACLGIACGAGFYEVVLLAALLIVFTMEVMSPLEVSVKRRLRNMTVQVTFDKLESSGKIARALEETGATVVAVELESAGADGGEPSAVLALKLSRSNPSHSSLLALVAEMDCVTSARELIS